MIFHHDDFVSCWYNMMEATVQGPVGWYPMSMNMGVVPSVHNCLRMGVTCGKCYEVMYDGGISGSCPGSANVHIIDELQEYTALYQFNCYMDTYMSITR